MWKSGRQGKKKKEAGQEGDLKGWQIKVGAEKMVKKRRKRKTMNGKIERGEQNGR